MGNNENLINFLKVITQNTKTIDDTLTASKHKRIILSSLNELLYEYPEWSEVLTSLSEYTKQKWALENKIKTKESIEVFKSGATVKELLSKYNVTENIVEIFDKAIIDEYFKINIFKNRNEYEAFEAAHDLMADDCSKYIMTTHYKNAVKTFCEKRGKEIQKELKSVKYEYTSLKEEEALVFHDTELLLKTLRYVLKKKRVLENINDEGLITLIKLGIEKIKEYPFSGETIAKIISSYVFEGKSDYQIGKEILASETFVRDKRKTATELLSLLLWGYSGRDMLNKMS